jgi:N-methylhydantoinase B
LTETFAGAGGARSFADGIEVGGEIPNPISRMANIETIEYTFPIRYLFRRRLKDSGGAGRYRGGVGMELAFIPHDAPDGGMHYVVSGKGAQFPMSDGLGGGYPGAPNAYVWVHNDELDDSKKADAQFAISYDAMPGNKEAIDWGVFPLLGDDALYVRWNGGGGYGDPLLRPAADVHQDVVAGLVSGKYAKTVYGVVINEPTMQLDEKASEQQRQSLLTARKANSTGNKSCS